MLLRLCRPIKMLAEGHSDKDIYLFAFLSGLIAASQEDLRKVIYKDQPYYLIHAMPDFVGETHRVESAWGVGLEV